MGKCLERASQWWEMNGHWTETKYTRSGTHYCKIWLHMCIYLYIRTCNRYYQTFMWIIFTMFPFYLVFCYLYHNLQQSKENHSQVFHLLEYLRHDVICFWSFWWLLPLALQLFPSFFFSFQLGANLPKRRLHLTSAWKTCHNSPEEINMQQREQAPRVPASRRLLRAN